MARKTAMVTISAEGRDQGKVFVLTELPTTRSEKWAARAFLAMARAGIDLPEDIESLGMAGLCTLGLRSLGGITFADAEPLLDEMMTCIATMPDPQNPNVVRPLAETDIEEIATRLQLRKEIVRLHVGFSSAAGS